MGGGDRMIIMSRLSGWFRSLSSIAKGEERLIHGRYRLLSVLSKTQRTTIYEAHDVINKRRVAIKCIGNSADADTLFRFKREYRVLRQLNHTGVYKAYDFGSDAKIGYFIVMEFVGGKNLAQLMQEKALSVAEAVNIIIKVLEVLVYAHGKGIIHRDIKTTNIMITKGNIVKLIDFGVALIKEDRVTQIGAIIGTRGFMSPEQQMAGQVVDERTDVFSAAKTLNEILGDRLQSPELSQLNNVIAKALALNPDDRYSSALAFAETLRTHLPAEEETQILALTETKVMLPETEVELAPGNILKRTIAGAGVLALCILAYKGMLIYIILTLLAGVVVLAAKEMRNPLAVGHVSVPVQKVARFIYGVSEEERKKAAAGLNELLAKSVKLVPLAIAQLSRTLASVTERYTGSLSKALAVILGLFVVPLLVAGVLGVLTLLAMGAGIVVLHGVNAILAFVSSTSLAATLLQELSRLSDMVARAPINMRLGEMASAIAQTAVALGLKGWQGWYVLLVAPALVALAYMANESAKRQVVAIGFGQPFLYVSLSAMSGSVNLPLQNLVLLAIFETVLTASLIGFALMVAESIRSGRRRY